MLTEYIVRYTVLGDDYEYFVCQAEDSKHATEQTIDAYPECDIINVFKEIKNGE